VDQLALNVFCNQLVFVLSMVFYEHDGSVTSARIRYWATIGLISSFLTMMLTLYIGVLLVVELGSDSKYVTGYAYALGIIAAVGPAFTWTTQIWTTYKLKTPGSFSILSLLIQTPGTFIVVVFQGIINKELIAAFSTTVAGIEQVILLVLCIYYIIKEKRAARAKASLVAADKLSINPTESAHEKEILSNGHDNGHHHDNGDQEKASLLAHANGIESV